MPIVTIAILQRGGTFPGGLVSSFLFASSLARYSERGVNQNSKPVNFCTLSSPSTTSLLFSNHSFLTWDLSHFSKLLRVLKRKIMTYSGLDFSTGLMTSTPR